MTAHAIQTEPETVEKNIHLAFDFARAIIADPSLLDEVPDGAMLALLPEHDPAQFDANLAIGLDAIRRGQDVYFRHVRRPPDAGSPSG